MPNLKNSKMKIYSKSVCPYCVMAKNLLDSLNINYEEIDISDDFELLEKISSISNMRTVPQIFKDEKTCLWGYDDIAKLHSEWKLLELISD